MPPPSRASKAVACSPRAGCRTSCSGSWFGCGVSPDDATRREHVAAIYTLRREALRTALAERGIESHGSSGLNVWIPVAHEDATVAALQSCGWGVLAGDRFRIASARGIRVTTSRLEPADARTVCRRRRDGAHTATVAAQLTKVECQSTSPTAARESRSSPVVRGRGHAVRRGEAHVPACAHRRPDGARAAPRPRRRVRHRQGGSAPRGAWLRPARDRAGSVDGGGGAQSRDPRRGVDLRGLGSREGRMYDLIVSGQAWHWVNPEVGVPKAGVAAAIRAATSACSGTADGPRRGCDASARGRVRAACPGARQDQRRAQHHRRARRSLRGVPGGRGSSPMSRRARTRGTPCTTGRRGSTCRPPTAITFACPRTGAMRSCEALGDAVDALGGHRELPLLDAAGAGHTVGVTAAVPSIGWRRR